MADMFSASETQEAEIEVLQGKIYISFLCLKHLTIFQLNER